MYVLSCKNIYKVVGCWGVMNQGDNGVNAESVSEGGGRSGGGRYFSLRNLVYGVALTIACTGGYFIRGCSSGYFGENNSKPAVESNASGEGEVLEKKVEESGVGGGVNVSYIFDSSGGYLTEAHRSKVRILELIGNVDDGLTTEDGREYGIDEGHGNVYSIGMEHIVVKLERNKNPALLVDIIEEHVEPVEEPVELEYLTSEKFYEKIMPAIRGEVGSIVKETIEDMLSNGELPSDESSPEGYISPDSGGAEDIRESESLGAPMNVPYLPGSDSRVGVMEKPMVSVNNVFRR